MHPRQAEMDDLFRQTTPSGDHYHYHHDRTSVTSTTTTLCSQHEGKPVQPVVWGNFQVSFAVGVCSVCNQSAMILDLVDKL